MKRFLIRIALTCLIPLPLIIAAVVMYFVEVNAYYRDLDFPANVTMTASDDSIMSLGLDPEYISNFANRSAAGMGMVVGEARLKDMIKMHPGQLKTVLFGLSTTKFCIPRDNHIGGSEREKAFLWILHPELRKTCLMREGENVYELFFQAEIPKRFRKWVQSCFSRKKKFVSDAAGRFEPIYSCDFKENPVKLNDQIQEFLGMQCVVEDFAANIAVRQSETFIRTAQSNNIEVILVKMPVHKVLREAYRPEVIASYHAACDYLQKEFGLKMLDYTSWNDTDDLWQNINHLNVNGAAHFSQDLARDLANGKGK